MSDEPLPKPPVRPVANNSPSDGKWPSANDILGYIVLVVVLIGIVAILLSVIVSAVGG